MFEEVSKNRRFGYARVSSQTQENNSSLEAQKQEFIIALLNYEMALN